MHSEIMHQQTSNSFEKKHRLLSAGDFKCIFDKADIKVSHPQFLILAKLSHLDQAHSRLGVIVAKKNVKLAVKRNVIKRLIRESFRTKQTHFTPINAIVLARKGADKLSNHEVHAVLNQLWERIVKKAAKAKLNTQKNE